MEKKMTYTAALSHVMTNYDLPEDVYERLCALHASLEKRAAAPHKPSKKQEAANAQTDNAVMDFMATTSEPVSAKAMMEGSDVLATFSVQKITSSCGRLVKAGKLEKIPGRPVTYKLVVEG